MLSRHVGLTPSRFGRAAVVLTICFVLAVCFLPHSRAVQFASSREPILHKAGWIYHRIHFDPTPLDAVFVGSSRSIYGIDDERVEAAASKALGSPLHVANFALIHPGRNMDYLIAREVLGARRPRLLVIEVQEDEPRAPHVAFYRLADAGDIVNAPLIINPRYFSDLIRLPSRQAALFIKTLAPDLFGADFNDARYQRTHWHDTAAELDDWRPRSTVLTEAELEEERRHFAAFVSSKTYLPAAARTLEYRASLIYLDKIISLARDHGVAVKFLYLPSSGSAVQPAFARYYSEYGAIWTAPKIFSHIDIWQDVNHLNENGSAAFSDWLGAMIATESVGSSTGRQLIADDNSCATCASSRTTAEGLP